jgi:uncharacterized protein YerC
MTKKDFKPIYGYENYEVNSDGIIRRTLNDKVIKPFIDDRGYIRNTIWDLPNKKNKQVKVHRVVWETFNDCRCEETIDHISGNKLDNNISNLRCITNKENLKNKKNTFITDYKLTPEKKGEIQKLLLEGSSLGKIYKDYGIPTNYISMVKKRGSWNKYIDGQQDLQGVDLNSK